MKQTLLLLIVAFMIGCKDETTRKGISQLTKNYYGYDSLQLTHPEKVVYSKHCDSWAIRTNLVKGVYNTYTKKFKTEIECYGQYFISIGRRESYIIDTIMPMYLGKGEEVYAGSERQFDSKEKAEKALQIYLNHRATIQKQMEEIKRKLQEEERNKNIKDSITALCHKYEK